MVVLFSHIIAQVNTSSSSADKIINIFNGTAAVCFFFVLSGLVVGMSLVKKDINFETMADYAIRRIFRIMPLLAITVTLGGICIYLLDQYLQFKYLSEELSVVKFLAGYIGLSHKANPPIWSIFVEIVGSVLLPLMVLTGRNIKHVLLCGAGLLLLASFDPGLHYTINLYILNFYVGLSILWWGRAFVEKVEKISTPVFWLMIAFCFAAFYLPRITFTALTGLPAAEVLGANYLNLLELGAITPLIAIVYYCPERFSLFSTRPFSFLGDVSYSLYLTHYLLIILTINAIGYVAPSLLAQPLLLCVVMAAVLVSLALSVAALSYRYIELPGIAMGKKFAAVFPFFRKPMAA